MYPEGWLIDPNGKFLNHFYKDEMSPKKNSTGYLDRWLALEGYPKTIKNQKKVSAKEAISEWIHLTESGWRTTEIEFEAKKVA